MEITQNDRRLISALQQDARQSVSTLARALNLSRTTVQKRLQKLEACGVIAGYSVRLSDAYQSSTLQVYVNLVVTPRCSSKVAAALERMAQVEALYSVSGKIDLVCILRVASPGALDAVLDQIGALEGVEDTESAIVLTTRLDRR
tara:strand:- start:97583 stop:98017 length:435 start_codon:yes stop_codon:yes gene_type:complete